MAIVIDGTSGLSYTGDSTGAQSLSVPQSVGIGTTSPGARLEVKGSSSDNATININNNSGNIWKLWNDNGASALNIQYNGSTRVVVDSSGNVGIGTNAPSSLRVTIEGSGSQLRIRNTTTRYRSDYIVGNSGSTNINSYDDTGATYMPFNIDASVITFSTPSTERMRIDSTGQVNIGTASAIAAGNYGLNVLKNTSSVGTVSTIKALGNSPSFELLNSDSTQNWYFGINDADAKKLYIGRGYGTNQGISPAIAIDVSDNVGIGTAAPIRKLHLNAGEFSLTPSITTAFINLSNATGNSGGSYSLVVRGLGTNGSAEVSLSNITLNSTTITTPAIVNNTSGRAILRQSGSVIQTLSTTLTTFGTTTSTTYVAVSGLSVTITPSNTSSQVLVRGYLYVTGSAQNGQFVALYRGGAILTGIIGAAGANAIQNGITGTVRASGGHIPASAAVTYVNIPLYFEYLDSPASTAAQVYQVYIRVGNGSTMYYNYQAQTGTNADFGYYASTITAQEIAA